MAGLPSPSARYRQARPQISFIGTRRIARGSCGPIASFAPSIRAGNGHGVIANDSAATAGAASVGAFYGDTGFVFLQNDPTVLMTMDAGVTWTSSRLPKLSNGDSVGPIAAYMPSQYVCYLLAIDNPFQTADALLKISFPKPSGQQGLVQTDAAPAIPFTAVYGTDAITFTMATAPEARSIQILDVLGRDCASVAITPNAASGQLAISVLRPGTYFANLGGSVVKFAIP